MVFVITNTEGDVDETIHDDESCGQSHMLTIKSESLDTDNSVRYSFHRGRCIVRAIFLPKKEGIVRLVASHSRYPELDSTVEVHVLQASKVEPETIPPPYTDGKVFLLQDSSALKAPKVEYDDVNGQFSDGKLLLLQDSSAATDVEDYVVSILNDVKELKDDMLEYGRSVGRYEQALEMLNARQLALEQEISMFQASLGPEMSNNSDNVTVKEAIVELIESKGDSAAAVVCRLYRQIPSREQHSNLSENILGVVAVLGTVQNNELSRVLAEYLGEDHMLAVVCKSYAAVDALKKNEKYGNEDHTNALHPESTELAISGRYVVICLEDTRPYTGEVGSDPDRKLALPNPALPSGHTPPGYLGYAVNMITVDSHHSHCMMDAGHGLRETLFYCLFGELQVYETRENMEMAKACIKHGAVSLDGGIMRGNGVLYLGHREPEICFPVVVPGSRRHSSPHSMKILSQIEENKSELKETLDQIERLTRKHGKLKKKFEKKKDRYLKFLHEKGHLLQGSKFGSKSDNSSAY